MFRKIKENWLVVLMVVAFVLAIGANIIDAVVPNACPKCDTLNIEKVYERKEYRYWVNGYECDECGYQFER